MKDTMKSVKFNIIVPFSIQRNFNQINRNNSNMNFLDDMASLSYKYSHSKF